MPSYKCSICGKIHDEQPMDIGYQKPADYFKIPPDGREKRIKLSSDLCSIDDSEFYIRGILALPIKDSTKEFRWGVWIRVQESDFKRHIELWDGNIPPDEPALVGYLSGGAKDYEDSDTLEVKVHLQPGNQRPRFEVVSDQHPLGIDQRNGITMAKAHSFAEPLLELTESPNT
jgi:hypothetical protein